MKTLHKDSRKDATMQPINALNADAPAWVSSMGMEWLYSVLQKSDVVAKPKTLRQGR